MSTSSSPSLHPTRRQLDELDALMERMLELPVDSTGEGTQEQANVSELSSDTSANAFAGFATTGFASYTTEESDASSLTNASGAFDFGPAVESSPARERTSPSPQPLKEMGADDAPLPVWLWPVTFINQVYDGVMARLGRPGHFFLGTGRAWLGWIGLIMLVGALAWGVLDWIHWAG